VDRPLTVRLCGVVAIPVYARGTAYGALIRLHSMRTSVATQIPLRGIPTLSRIVDLRCNRPTAIKYADMH
jgi:hypothetical protein